MINFKNIELQNVVAHSKGRTKYLVEGKEHLAEEAAIRYYKSLGLNALWTENNYWWTVISLLFWDEIFAKVKGAVIINENGIDLEIEPKDRRFDQLFSATIQMNGMPIDLFAPEFYVRRKNIIDDKIQQLQRSDISELLKRFYKNNYGKKFRLIEDWDKFKLDELQIASQNLDNKHLIKVSERFLTNIVDNRSGFPDLIVYNPGVFYFSEVKSENDKISSKQKDWHIYLSDVLGLNVELFLINHTKEQIEKTKKLYTQEVKEKIIRDLSTKDIKFKANIVQIFRSEMKGVTKDKQVDLYYELLKKLQEHKRNRQYIQMLEGCRLSWPLIEATLKWAVKGRVWKSKDVTALDIPSVIEPCRYYPVTGNIEELKILHELIYSLPEFKKDYKEIVDEALVRYDLSQKIYSVINENESILEKDLEKLIDQEKITGILGDMAKVGRINRIKEGSTYRLTIVKDFGEKYSEEVKKSKTLSKASQTGCVLMLFIIFFVVIILSLI